MKTVVALTLIRQSMIGLICALVLGGCDVGLGGGVIFINRTGAPLTINQHELRPDGGSWNYSMSGCSQSDLVILDAAGDEYARIDAGWCEGETWTITGRDEVSVDAQE